MCFSDIVFGTSPYRVAVVPVEFREGGVVVVDLCGGDPQVRLRLAAVDDVVHVGLGQGL